MWVVGTSMMPPCISGALLDTTHRQSQIIDWGTIHVCAQMQGTADEWMKDGPYAGLSKLFYVVAYARNCSGQLHGSKQSMMLALGS